MFHDGKFGDVFTPTTAPVPVLWEGTGLFSFSREFLKFFFGEINPEIPGRLCTLEPTFSKPRGRAWHLLIDSCKIIDVKKVLNITQYCMSRIHGVADW